MVGRGLVPVFSEAALLLTSYINKTFDVIVTGSSVSATWVRIFEIPARASCGWIFRFRNRHKTSG
jgi:hypothetical protein